MTHNPHILTEIQGLVFDTNEYDQPWYYQDPYEGVPVDARIPLAEVTASFYFLIPLCVTEDDPPLKILTVAKGLPGDSVSWPRYRDPVLLRDVGGGIYVQVTYHPRSHEIRVTMNVGGESRVLAGVVLEGASPDEVRGRILELYAEISPGRIFASVNDRFLGGDFALDATAPSTGGPACPWGSDPSGNWFVVSGLRDGRHEGATSLPVGFGLSDLRITLGSESSAPLGSLPYDGALDRVLDPFWEDEDPFWEDEDPFDPDDLAFSLSEKTLPESLYELAHQLDWMHDDARRWAQRARALAQETEQMAMQLPTQIERR